jgi:hypothetical protein
MVVPGGTAGGRVLVAGWLLAAGALLVVIGLFLPVFTVTLPGPMGNVTTVRVWLSSNTVGDQTTAYPTWTTGVWLVLVTALAVAAAVTLFVHSRRSAWRVQALGAFSAGLLGAGAAGQALPFIAGSLFDPGPFVYRPDAGLIVMVLAALCAIAAGIVAISVGPRAPAHPGQWVPGPPPPSPWGAPPPPPTRPFPAQPTNTGSFPVQPPRP